ncbi:MAG TPA: ABC transporter permease subunit [Gemmatimonadales bacterium]|nr:ABC transporter permease subunit [Gemmatimonadales bacterium]
MRAAVRILRFELDDVRRSRAVLAYGLLLLTITEAVLRFGGGGPRAVVSLLNVVLILVPLVSVVFGTMHLYGAREFTELLLVQPVGRGSLYAGLLGGLTLPLCLAFLGGVGLPFAWHAADGAGSGAPLATLLGAGVLLTVVFTGLASVVAIRFDDRAKGLGTGLLAWLALAVVYDALVLFVITAWGDYPIEGPLTILSLLNPVDAARIALLLQLDAPALLGYTGATLSHFFGTAWAFVAAALALTAWTGLPAWAGWRAFRRKDF